VEGRKDESGRFLHEWFTRQLRVLDAGRRVELLNGNDLVAVGGEELEAQAEAVIRQAERECESSG
jgi:hypothetical protein